MQVGLGPGARCFLGTQSATRVYRNSDSLPCSQRIRATLGPGSLLVFAPDPVQSFARSSYVQQQVFDLGPGAGLVLLDSYSSGRAARGERWAFSRFESRSTVHRDGKLLWGDSVLLDPADGPLDGPFRAGRWNCFAMLLVFGGSALPLAEAILGEFRGQPVLRGADLVFSVSPLREGAVLKIAGESVERVGQTLRRPLGGLATLLGDDPWARKW
jgi:urease accessory protein